MANVKKFSMNYKYLLPVVIVVGFLLRIAYVSNLDFYYDEASHAMGQRALIEKGVSPWDTVNWQPPLYSYTASILTRILGLSEFSFRLTSVIFGTFSIILVYYIGKLWFDKKTGLLASILLAVSPLHVIYSRTAFSDVFHTFFVILTIFTIEFLILKKQNKDNTCLIMLAGVLTAVTFLIKYNTLIPFGIYWIFVLGYALIKRKKKLFKKYFVYMLLINLIALMAGLIIILLTGGIPRLVLVIHNVLLSTFLQFEQFTNPYHYTFLVLFEGLSPLIALLMPFVIIYLILHKNRNRNDYLIIFFVLVYILLFLLQTRRLARHLVMTLPLLMIILSRFLVSINKNISDPKKYLNFIFILLLILSSASWSIYEVKKINGFHVWTEIREYIKKNYQDDISVHGSLHKNRPIGFYIRNADNRELISTLKKGDLVIFTWLNKNSTIMENSPFEDNVMFYSRKRTEFSPEFISYVLKHGELVKTFEYKQGIAAWLYEIKSIDRNAIDVVKEEPFTQISLFGIWDIVCDSWNKKQTRKIIEKIVSTEQVAAIQIKCSYLN